MHQDVRAARRRPTRAKSGNALSPTTSGRTRRAERPVVMHVYISFRIRVANGVCGIMRGADSTEGERLDGI
jgi:hypothetical protein